MKHLLLISLIFTSSLLAEFKVGEKLPNITLLDQFDKSFAVDSNDNTIIMAFEKDISIAISDYLMTKPASFLQTQHAKYISDISTMPSMVTSMFALPKMQKYPFSVLLIRDDLGKQFNRKDGKATVFKLKNKKIETIEFVAPSAISGVFSR